MLTGTIKDIKNNYVYNVKAVDTSTTMQLTLTSSLQNALNHLLDEQFRNNDTDIDERRVDIQIASVVVQTEQYKDTATDKMKKTPVNSDFFCRLGALIRYAKTHCNTSTQTDYTGLTLASKEFEAVPDRKYKVEFTDTAYAELSLSFGDITSLNLVTDDFEIKLDTNNREATPIFPRIKNGIKLGIKFDEEYLGFKVPEQIVETIEDVSEMYANIEEVIAAHPDKELKWLLGKNYIIVDDEHLEEICNYIADEKHEFVYYDTETTGLNITFKSRIGQADQLVGVVLSVKFGESYFFPTQMKSIPNLCGGDHFYFMEHYMRPILEGKKLVAHNMSFDWKVAYIYDINANIVHDTMALYKLTLGAEKKNFPMSLKETAKIILNRDSLELSDLIRNNSWGETDIKFWDLPYELVRLYACADTDNTMGLLLYAQESDLLGKYGANKTYEIEINFSLAVAYQEFYGHRLNLKNLSKIREDLGNEQADLMKKMEDIVGHSFNPNSPKQLQTVMYDELKIPKQIDRASGKVTTNKETLSNLAELTDIEGNTKYPFCKLLKEYREYEGVRKIVDKFPEHMTPDGYIFSSVMQYGTTTGRVSVNSPNYQSYNDPIKKNVIPREGFYMFDTDYSSVEYRVLGNMVGNKGIMKAFEDPDFDYHKYQAAHMYNVPYSAVTKKLRKAAKGINFGLPYGMGDESLGVRVFGEPSPENTRKAAALRAAYFKGQEDIRDWFEFHRNHGVNEGYTETYFGRRRYYYKQDFSEAKIRRQAGNQVIQGCLSGDTRIQTKEFGIVKLKDVVGQRLHIWNGTKWTLGDITESGKKQKCVVRFSGGQEIVCSPIHKFLVRSHKGNERFVECQNLISSHDNKNSRNGHRVVISQNYEPSDYVYNSRWAYKFKGESNNSKNSFLEDISDRFELGRFLGRLASDGSISCREDGSDYITQFVAEHEYNILPELQNIMSTFNTKVRVKDRTNEDKKEMTELSVYSQSLVAEISNLDVKHQVADNIFQDTEVLRGFLSGMYDGDGGISGKTITLTFGVQLDFEPMIKDLQKALLFFGIRSRYRYYEHDRYVLAIKTTDNQRFLELIGFLNKDKQTKGLQLTSKEDEHIFGRCLLVDSVEITDEYIDMYDVCNTEDGYYVADGFVTHNTAADIYKLAVGRVFKRVCREGWLGKVLFTGFIHDELLGEVSNDINPAVFLKMLREEFEVKIKNTDGTPWCPLYMGFGYGMSWYEAKSTELSIKLQWEIVDKYGESGFPNWEGNGREFCDTVPDMIRDFEVRDISNQLLDADSQGKEIKATLNDQLLDCIKADAKYYQKGIKEYADDMGWNLDAMDDVSSWLYNNHDEIVADLDKKYHIQNLYKVDDDYQLEFTPSKSTQEVITQFCQLHNVDRTKINLLDIPDVDVTENNLDEATYISQGVDESELSEEKLQEIKDTRVRTWGMYLDVPNKEVILLMLPAEWLSILQSHTNKEGNGYNIIFKDYEKKMTYNTKAYITSQEVSFVQNLYLQYINRGN